MDLKIGDKLRRHSPMQRLINVGYLVCTLIMVVGQLVGSASALVTAGATGQEIPITYSNEKLLLNGQAAPTDIDLNGNSQTFDLSYDFDIKNPGNISAGDYFYLTDIPNLFKAATPLGLTVSVKDQNTGDEIASGTYTGTSPMKFVFSKAMTEAEITGSIQLTLEITNSGTFSFGGYNYTVKNTGGSGTGDGDAYDLSKFSAIAKGGRYDFDVASNTLIYTWNVYLNAKRLPAGTYTIKDTLPRYLSYAADSYTVSGGHLDVVTKDDGSAWLRSFKSGSAGLEEAQLITDETVTGNSIQWTVTIPEGNTKDYEIKYQTIIKGDDPNLPKMISSDGQLWATNTVSIAGANGDELGDADSRLAFAAAGSGIGDYDDTGMVKIAKQDAATKAYLAGATFNLLDADGQVIDTVTTDEYGQAAISGLKAGGYQVVETKAPKGYTLDSTPTPVTVQIGQVAAVNVQDTAEPQGGVILTKTDADTGAPLAGATFELQDANGETLKSDLVTDETGELTVEDLQAADYQLVETKAPAGYILDATPVKFTIAAGQSQPVAVAKTNVAQTGSVVLTKSDADTGKALAGATFVLQNTAGETLKDNLISAENGKITVDNLKPGDYQFVETAAPKGYVKDDTPVRFAITKGQTQAVQVTKTNEEMTGGVELTKVDAATKAVLAGARFALQDAEGNSLRSGLITNQNGQITVTGLKPGNYQFVETSAPKGYLLDAAPVTFKIALGQTATVKVEKKNQSATGDVVLTKTDADTHQALAGATFELDDAEGNLVKANLVTDEAGQLTMKGLKAGDYQFIETLAPAGYNLNITPVKFTIVAGQKAATTVTVANTEATSGVVLTKIDADTKAILAGAKFDLQDVAGKVLKSNLVTDEKGQLAVDGLKPGDYQFVETAAPKGYKLDAKPVGFTIHLGQTLPTRVTVKNEETTGSIVLTKLDADTGKTLAGATFALQDAEGTVLKDDLVSDEAGEVAVSGLKPGSYQFVETKAPKGYKLDTTPVKATIALGQTQPIHVTKTNVETTSGVVLTKTDADNGKVIAGATFLLQDATGRLLSVELVTNKAGQISLHGLKPGNYQFVETKAANGYDLDETPVKFSIALGQTTSTQVTKENTETTNGVELTKTDADTGANLAGATFDLQDAEGKRLKTGLVSNQDGKILVDGLKPGDYQFVETAAPKGYDLDAAPVKFTITLGQPKLTQVTKANEETTGGVTLTKTDADTGRVLRGAVFNLDDASGKTLKRNLMTDRDGKLTINGLKPGHYQFVETAAPKGYDLDATPVKFTIALGQAKLTQVTKANEETTGGVILTKTDADTDEDLAGATFELQDAEGKVLAANLTSDQAGHITVNDLKPGSYQFVETKAPKGYNLDSVPVKFTITLGQTKLVQVAKTNEETTSGVTLTKTDADTGESLAGATFELQTSDGKTLKTGLTSDVNGKITVNNLKSGNYQFVETKAPKGYDLDSTPVKFTITLGQAKLTQVTKTNAETTSGVTLTKTDADTGESLAGATFELQTSDGKTLKTGLTSDVNGKITVNNLKPGNYQFVETKAPKGYELDSAPVKFTIALGQTKLTQVTKTNAETTGGVILTKTDADTSEILAGATFELQTSDSKTLKTGLTSDAAGKIAVNNLKPGSYQFVETKAAKGYDLDSTPVKFTIALGQTKLAQVTKTNAETTGGVILTKTDADTGESLAGATFDLQSSTGKALKAGLTSDQDGHITVDGLKPGNYQFVETEAPKGYDLDAAPVKFTIALGQSQLTQVAKANAETTGRITLTKYDLMTKQTLAGAIYDLFNADGQRLARHLITTESGEVSVTDLKPGDYYFVEVQAPTGYEKDQAPIPARVELGQTGATKVVQYDTPMLTPNVNILTPHEPHKPREPKHQSKLPQTGDEHQLGVLLLGLTTLVGLAGINAHRRRHQLS